MIHDWLIEDCRMHVTVLMKLLECDELCQCCKLCQCWELCQVATVKVIFIMKICFLIVENECPNVKVARSYGW